MIAHTAAAAAPQQVQHRYQRPFHQPMSVCHAVPCCAVSQVHVEPLYAFPVALDLDAVDDLLIQQPSPQQQQQQNNASPKQQQQQQWQPMLGSLQHGALWEAFMKKAKKQQQHTAMEPIDEEQQQQPECLPPPPPPPRPAAAVNGNR